MNRLVAAHTAVCAVLLTLAAPAASAQREHPGYARAVGPKISTAYRAHVPADAVLRRAPAPDAPEAGRLLPGDSFTVYDVSGDFVAVATPVRGPLGWLPAGAVVRGEPVASAADALAVRTLRENDRRIRDLERQVDGIRTYLFMSVVLSIGVSALLTFLAG